MGDGLQFGHGGTSAASRGRVAFGVAGLVGIVLLGFAGVVVWSLLEGARFDAATVLPDDTVAYARFSNLPQVWEAMEKSGLRRTLRDLVEDEAGRDARDIIRGLEDLAARLQSLHVSFHGLHGRRDPVPTLMVIAELDKPAPLDELLPRDLMRELDKAGEHGGVQIYQVDNRELDREGVGILLASTRGKLLVANDESLLEDTLDALDTGRKDSLASHADYQAVRRGQEPRDLELVVSAPELLAVIERGIRRFEPHDLDEFRAVVELCGLEDVRFASYAASYAGDTAVVRVVADEDCLACQLLAQPMTERAIVDVLPDDVLGFIAAGIGDGGEKWSRLRRAIPRALRRAGERRAADAFDEGLREFERETRVRLDEIAEQLEEIGFFAPALSGPNRLDDEFCIVAKVKDPDRARAILPRLSSLEFKGPTTTYRHRGETVNVIARREGSDNEFVWAIVDDCVLISPERRVVEDAIDAKEKGSGLKQVKEFEEVLAKLDKENAVLAYLDVEKVARLALRRHEWERSPEGYFRRSERYRDGFRELPRTVRDLLTGLSVGACVTVEGGVIEARVTRTKEITLEDAFELLNDALEKEFGRRRGYRRRDYPWIQKKGAMPKKRPMPKKKAYKDYKRDVWKKKDVKKEEATGTKIKRR